VSTQPSAPDPVAPDPAVLLENRLFDFWVLERRAGRDPRPEDLAAQLPEGRRDAFVRLLRDTAALQFLSGVPDCPPEPAGTSEKPAEGP
jgi:hypothetical protein